MQPNGPQPGRITLKQLPGKIPGGTSPAPKTTSDIKEVSENPTGAIAEKAMGVVTSQYAAADSQNRFNRALSLAHKTERVPTQPQYRLSLVEGGILIGVCGAVDIIDWIAGLFCEVIVGEIIVIIVDTLFGILMACYCRFRLKLPVLAHVPIYLSVVAALLIDHIPFINAAWWLDAWYIVHTIRAEDRATHQQLLQKIEEERQEEARQEWLKNYQERQTVQEEAEEEEQE